MIKDETYNYSLFSAMNFADFMEMARKVDYMECSHNELESLKSRARDVASKDPSPEVRAEATLVIAECNYARSLHRAHRLGCDHPTREEYLGNWTLEQVGDRDPAMRDLAFAKHPPVPYGRNYPDAM